MHDNDIMIMIKTQQLEDQVIDHIDPFGNYN
jgi:hypothetical protein